MKNILLCLFCALAFSRAAYPITATKAYVDSATNDTLAAAKAYTDTVAGVTPQTVTNIASAVVAPATNALSSVMLPLILERATSNDVNAIIASSNLCTVAAAQAMTTGLVSKAGSTMNNGATLKFQVYDDTFEFSTTLTPTIIPVGIGGYLSGVYGGTFVAYENWGSIVKWYGSTYQTLPEYIDSLSWRTTGNRTLANYGIHDAYTKAYAEATFAPKLTGRTYDFDHGSNFTMRVYQALTNVIQTLGGNVRNPPTFN